MQTIHAIFENGVFRPVGPVQLPENCEVVFEPRPVSDDKRQDVAAIYAILDERYTTGEPDIAARHDELDP